MRYTPPPPYILIPPPPLCLIQGKGMPTREGLLILDYKFLYIQIFVHLRICVNIDGFGFNPFAFLFVGFRLNLQWFLTGYYFILT